MTAFLKYQSQKNAVKRNRKRHLSLTRNGLAKCGLSSGFLNSPSCSECSSAALTTKSECPKGGNELGKTEEGNFLLTVSFSQRRLMVPWEGKLHVPLKHTGRPLLPTQEKKHEALGKDHGKLLNSR